MHTMAQKMFVFTHNDVSYSVPTKHLPWRGKHGEATNIAAHKHDVYGDYICFNVTSDKRSPEAGRRYSVQYFVRDGYTQYNTVN